MKVLTALRVTKDGLKDLVSTNNWQHQGQLTFDSGKFSQYGIHMQNGYIFCSNLPANINSEDDCTLTFWVKAIDDIIFALSPNSHTGSNFYFHNVYYGINPADLSWQNMYSETLPKSNEWNYCTFCREKGIGYLFLNGKLLKSGPYPWSIMDNPIIYTHMDGWDDIQNAIYDDLCIVKGRALWTKDFTPPYTYLADMLFTKKIYIDNKNVAWATASTTL